MLTTPYTTHASPHTQQKAAAEALAAEAEKELPPVDKSTPLRTSVLGRDRADDWRDAYEIGRVLGVGQFGVIRLATDKQTGLKYACKSIPKGNLTQSEAAIIRQELQIMHHLAGVKGQGA
jgi:serine/threonine protein kinase